MVRRGYVANNKRYHAPEQPTVREILSSVKWKSLTEQLADLGQKGKEQEQPHPTIHASTIQRRWEEREEGGMGR